MKTLYLKLFAIQTKGVQVSKDGVNPHFKSKYMTLDNIIETLSPLLAENKILVTHFVKDQALITRVVDVESGEDLDSSFGLLATDPQKKGSEITYAKRYNLSALFNICADEDDDGNIASAPTQSEPEKPWITKQNIENLMIGIKEGRFLVSSAEGAVKFARETYAVSKDSANKIMEEYKKFGL